MTCVFARSYVGSGEYVGERKVGWGEREAPQRLEIDKS